MTSVRGNSPSFTGLATRESQPALDVPGERAATMAASSTAAEVSPLDTFELGAELPLTPEEMRVLLANTLEGRLDTRGPQAPSTWAQFGVGHVVATPSTMRAGAGEAVTAAVRSSTLEREALTALSPDDRSRYERLQSTFGDDVRSNASLLLLLVNGSLSGPRGSEVLQQLERIRSADARALLLHSKLPETYDDALARKVLGATVQELAIREVVSQGKRKTCGVTALIGELARLHPHLYTRMVADLLIHQQATLPNGAVIRAERDAIGDRSGRTPSQRLLQPALKQYSNPLLRYDNTAKESSFLFFRRLGDGSEPAEIERVARALFKVDFEILEGDRSFVAGQIATAVGNGVAPLFVSLKEADSEMGHLIAIDRIFEAPDGKGRRVELYDPNGHRVSLSWSAFEKLVNRAYIPREGSRTNDRP